MLICLVLYAEEAGLPIPAPGEAVLIGAGLLVAGGGSPLWLVFPALLGAIVAGALTGFGWARWVGAGRLRGLARRFRFEGPFDQVGDRLRTARIRDVALSRLIPGLRVYTTLVAGGVGVRPRVFVGAVVLAGAAWVATFTALGVFVGVPAERLIGRAEGFALRLGLALGILAAGYILIRRLPDQRPITREVPVGGWRAMLAFATDVLTVGALIAGLGILTGLEVGELDTPVASSISLTALAVIYLLVARRSVGHTLGELIMRVRYR